MKYEAAWPVLCPEHLGAQNTTSHSYATTSIVPEALHLHSIHATSLMNPPTEAMGWASSMMPSTQLDFCAMREEMPAELNARLWHVPHDGWVRPPRASDAKPQPKNVSRHSGKKRAGAALERLKSVLEDNEAPPQESHPRVPRTRVDRPSASAGHSKPSGTCKMAQFVPEAA